MLWLPSSINDSNIGSLCGILCSVVGEGPFGSAAKQQGQSYYLRIDVYLGQSVISTNISYLKIVSELFKHISKSFNNLSFYSVGK